MLGRDTRSAQVWLDGVPVPVQMHGRLDVPALWTGIAETPGLDGEPLAYEASLADPAGLRFTLAVGPGQHQVRVQYRVRAGSNDAGTHPNRTWQVAYSLAPARLWAGFGQLDVTVLVPEGWDAAASLPLRDDGGGRLVGRFAGVPGDVLAVAVRAPRPAGRRVLHGLAFLAAVVVAAAFGALGGIAVGRRGARGRRGRCRSRCSAASPPPPRLVVLRSIADGLGDSVAIGYGAMMTNILILGPATLALGTALAQTVVAIVAGRVQTERSEPYEPFGAGHAQLGRHAACAWGRGRPSGRARVSFLPTRPPMGQQQLLLLVLGIVIVGLAVTVGIQAFGENQRKSRQDQTQAFMVEIGTRAQAWKLTHPAMGGGSGTAANDFRDIDFAAMGFEATGTQGSTEYIRRTEYACLKLFPGTTRLQINALNTDCSNGSWWMRLDVTGTGPGDYAWVFNASNTNGNGQ